MIVGMGVDLCEVGRLEETLAAAHGPRFLERVFTPVEIAYAGSKGNRSERLAARFAAKEAAMKALGTGWSAEVGWQDIEVTNLESGQPVMTFKGGAAAVAQRMGVKNILVSLSHARGFAVASVVLERD